MYIILYLFIYLLIYLFICLFIEFWNYNYEYSLYRGRGMGGHVLPGSSQSDVPRSGFYQLESFKLSFNAVISCRQMWMSALITHVRMEPAVSTLTVVTVVSARQDGLGMNATRVPHCKHTF